MQDKPSTDPAQLALWPGLDPQPRQSVRGMQCGTNAHIFATRAPRCYCGAFEREHGAGCACPACNPRRQGDG